MTDQFEARLLECLEALGKRGSVEGILMRYPEDADGLRRALALANALPILSLAPDEAKQAHSRRKFLAEAGTLAEQAASHARRGGPSILRLASILAVTLALAAIPLAASASALPGDALYGVKRGLEDVRVLLAPTDAALRQQLHQERLREIESLLREGRTAQVQLDGVLEAVSPGAIRVSGKSIQIPAGMALPDISLGTPVLATVEIRDGALILVNLVPLPGAGAPMVTAPSPTPVREPTPTLGAGVLATNRPEAESTAAPQHEETLAPVEGSPSADKTPEPTEIEGHHTEEPSPTATVGPTESGKSGGSDGTPEEGGSHD